MPSSWFTWWTLLCGAALLNAGLWAASARLLAHRERDLAPADRELRRRLLLLAAVYAAGCAFRSVFPMVDVPRMCLHDTWVSRIAVGRAVATVAELAFAAQWALLLREAGGASRMAGAFARVLVPLIVVAEMFSWGAVLASSYLLHAIENSLWAAGALLVVGGFLALVPRVGAHARRFVAAVAVCGAAYIIFMVVVDVPMYLARWEAQLAAGIPWRSLSQGVAEVLDRCLVTRNWAAWREDVPWLTLYFTVAVWISLALPHAPPLHGRARGRSG